MPDVVKIETNKLLAETSNCKWMYKVVRECMSETRDIAEFCDMHGDNEWELAACYPKDGYLTFIFKARVEEE